MVFSFILHDLQVGGAEKQAFLLARSLKERGHKVFFIAFKNGPLNDFITKDKISIRCLNWPHEVRPRIVVIINKLICLATLAYLLRKLKPDILMPYTIYPNVKCGLLWKFTSAKICIWNQRDNGLKLKPSFFTKIALKCTPAFIANSREAANYLINQLFVKADKIRVIANCVEINNSFNKFSNENRDKYKIDLDCFVVCMIANITNFKDHITLMECWKQFLTQRTFSNKAKLLLVGRHGNAYSQVIQKATDLKIMDSVSFLGYIPTVYEIISFCDLAAYSSNEESSPNGAIECMANGLAIVGTNIEGLRSIVSIGNIKYLSDPGDAKTMANNFLFLEKNKKIRRDIGAANKENCQLKFSLEACVSKTMDAIRAFGKNNILVDNI